LNTETAAKDHNEAILMVGEFHGHANRATSLTLLTPNQLCYFPPVILSRLSSAFDAEIGLK